MPNLIVVLKKKNNNLEITLWGTSVGPLSEPHSGLPRQGSWRSERTMEGFGEWEKMVTPLDKRLLGSVEHWQ